ncbi:secondary thiamine-phosphate synthase enzyme [Methanolobus tindarius DSM 2278]|uniref:Secondary thiamine-phosphate synthase enzyme n=1 Tax=Methanolobus tindarius DSM 2278 TaxID=1090322 RepID=W9DU56_METTI|nr:secondary thiamine-phosphate synthase enzyme YjbQ [Methanolobus tindarius]ETA69338.1 secondary thiamine-phosphate synthase enzyme [Methanolobus tindarius DSM 2278]
MQIKTGKRIELIDITDRVKEQLHENGVQNGICVISTKHTTTSVIVNENESGLVSDILELLKILVPAHAGYAHDRIDNNADAHLKAVLLGSSETLPIIDGNLHLGTWQSIFFAEMDGPRTREVTVTVISSE